MAESRGHWLLRRLQQWPDLANHTYTLAAFLAACLLVPIVIALCTGKHVSSQWETAWNGCSERCVTLLLRSLGVLTSNLKWDTGLLQLILFAVSSLPASKC